MEFVRKTITFKNAVEDWLTLVDKDNNPNERGICYIKPNNSSPYLYYGDVSKGLFNGMGVQYTDTGTVSFGRYNSGKAEDGLIINSNAASIRNYKNPHHEFIIENDGDWLFYEEKEFNGKGKRGIRYTKSTNKLEFVLFKGGINEAFTTKNVKPVKNVVEALNKGGVEPYKCLRPISFKTTPIDVIHQRFNDVKNDSGNTGGKNVERYWASREQHNGSNNGLGYIIWNTLDGKFDGYYFGEWYDGLRHGLGVYRYKDPIYDLAIYKEGTQQKEIVINYYGSSKKYTIDYDNVKCRLYYFVEPSADKSIFGIEYNGYSIDVFQDMKVIIYKDDNGWKQITKDDFPSFDDEEVVTPTKGSSDSSFDDLLKDLGFGGISGPSGDGEGDLTATTKTKKKTTTTTPTKKKEKASVRLQKLVGLEKVKKRISLLQAVAKKSPGRKQNLNFAFVGNPGTGKTEVARLFAEILYESKLLPENKLIEVSRSDLVGQYIGESEKKTAEIIDKAMGGVLFVDEAYALYQKEGNDFGKRVIEALLKLMEDHRGEICVILAGYEKEMFDLFQSNAGFKSRIPDNNYVVFDNYTEKEIREIAKLMISMDEDIEKFDDDAFEELVKYILKKSYMKNFDNARAVRTAINAALEYQMQRTADDPKDHTITLADVKSLSTPDSKKDSKNKSAEEKLNELIGLEKVKKQILSLKNTMKKFKSVPDKTNLHMAFLGNPGTGKTEVAKLMAEILYDEGILPSKTLIEVDSSGLIAEYVGQTGPKTHEVVERALGGVLFIDEAYHLASKDSSFGADAITALLKDMEDYRGKFAVILAGYTKEMMSMIETNPGFKSRIVERNYIDFEDYSVDELMQIAKLMVAHDGYTITDDALVEFKKLILIGKQRKYFENARYVRNTLQSIESFQNSRTVDSESDLLITIDDVRVYEEDMGYKDSKGGETVKVGDCIKADELNALPKCLGPVNANFIIERSVSIRCETTTGAGEGTGFFISPDGWIATNNHVIEDGVKVTVGINYVLSNGGRIKVETDAKIIRADKAHDVAIIKIERPDETMPYFTLVDQNERYPDLLTDVIMGGYPLGKSRFNDITLTQGSVQSINRDTHIGDGMIRIYVDLSGTHGNSGSAVLDKSSGKVIGIFSGASVDREANAELNFVIPTKYIWDLINQ